MKQLQNIPTKNRFHGLFSLALLDIATVLALYVISKASMVMAASYFLISVACFGLIVYFFCGKCLSRQNCGHVFFGPLTKKLPSREQSQYSFTDYFMTVFALLVFFTIPQFWLWESISFGIIYWILVVFSLIEVQFFVCKTCHNSRCPNCPKLLTF